MKQSRNNLFNTALSLLMCVLSLNTSSSALSATDGTMGAISSATAAIHIAIPQLYQITGISNFSFGSYSGSGNLSANDDLCIYTNDTTTSYKVRMTDDSTLSPSSYTVQNAAGTSQIPYDVRWKNGIGSNGNTAMNYNTPLAQTGANTTTPNCGGTSNANIQINILQSDLTNAPADVYSATLTISIEP